MEGTGGQLVDEARLTAVLGDQSRTAPMLLQRRLENLSDLAALGPAGLCTVRLVTIRAPDDETPEPLLALFRMPIGSQVADNFARGGLASPIELSTGTLAMAVYKDVAAAHNDVASHPDTGAVIAGRRLPQWRDVLTLAMRAHQAFAEFPSVGWDIAITADGPVLIEGNHHWDLVLAQQADCRPLGSTRFIEHERAWRRWAKERAITG